ncbi:MAG: hypothetical protein WAR01_13985 [Dokdonella sp.]|uniref:hypothetical protein n=1 Tax=Dokdonella sp. TaxID=2291710 RepID=UPI003BB05F9F
MGAFGTAQAVVDNEAKQPGHRHGQPEGRRQKEERDQGIAQEFRHQSRREPQDDAGVKDPATLPMIELAGLRMASGAGRSIHFIIVAAQHAAAKFNQDFACGLQVVRRNHDAKSTIDQDVEPVLANDILVEQLGIDLPAAQQAYEHQAIHVFECSFDASHPDNSHLRFSAPSLRAWPRHRHQAA